MAEYGLPVDMVLWSVVDAVDMLTCLESQDRYVSVLSGYNYPCICYKLNNSMSNINVNRKYSMPDAIPVCYLDLILKKLVLQSS